MIRTPFVDNATKCFATAAGWNTHHNRPPIIQQTYLIKKAI